ncbi:MAG: PAS domain-containing sensor histidine kinase, partial [Dehalococcoidia bacterium]
PGDGIEQTEVVATIRGREFDPLLLRLRRFISDVIWTMDLDLNFTYISPSVEQLTGYTAEECQSLELRDLIAPASFEIAWKAVTEAIASDVQDQLLGVPDTRTLDLQVIHKNGYNVYTEIKASLIHDDEGKPTGILGVARNINDRKFAEQALKDREEMLRATCDSSPGGILVVSSEGKIVHHNARFVDMWRIPEAFRWTTDENSLLQHVALEQLKDPETFLAKAREIYASVEDSYDLIYFKDGRIFERYSSPLIREGEIKGRVWAFLDVSERKKAEQDLQQSRNDLERSLVELRVANEKLKDLDKVKDDFISIVSHELRTPLTSIKSFTEILLDYENNSEIQDEFLGIINEECDRLTRLLNDFLDLSKMESGKMVWKTASVDLRDVIETAANSIDALLQGSSLSLELSIDNSLPPVWGDRDRFVQVVTNLLSNAFKFSPEGGRIQVKARRNVSGSDESPDMIKVSVIDNGPGFGPDEQDIVFRKFAQLGNSSPDKPRGTGLGLPISREIIEHYGGSLMVESEPGRGSNFYFILPVATRENHPHPSEILSS